MNANVLQLLPRVPGTLDGVGDYALTLARSLREEHGINSVFIARETQSKTEIESFPVFPLAEFSRARAASESCDGIVLHYVNYGFHKRGVPLTLVDSLKRLRRECGAALLVIFHELFATGPPWRSEFWLKSVQKKIARDVAHLADARLVSCESMQAQLAKLSPDLSAMVQPVTSTWGEPPLDDAQLRERDPHCWIICGGTALIEGSLRSFLRVVHRIPSEFAPRRLWIIGGAQNPHVRALLNAPAEFSAEYLPAITPEVASRIFCAAAFAWIDYFASTKVPADVLLKSSTFAALCAHGVVPVMPAVAGVIAINGDVLPGPFTVADIPRDHAAIAVATYAWYQRHASRAALARTVAQELQLA
jgi:hypothetical protein